MVYTYGSTRRPRLKKGSQYSAEEVAEARKKWQREGGLIKILPDQVIPQRGVKQRKNIPQYESIFGA